MSLIFVLYYQPTFCPKILYYNILPMVLLVVSMRRIFWNCVPVFALLMRKCRRVNENLVNSSETKKLIFQSKSSYSTFVQISCFVALLTLTFNFPLHRIRYSKLLELLSVSNENSRPRVQLTCSSISPMG